MEPIDTFSATVIAFLAVFTVLFIAVTLINVYKNHEETKLEIFTHKATLWGVPVYFNVETNAVKGVNRLWDVCLDVLIYLELRWPASGSGCFEITLKRELTDKEKTKANR